MTLATLFVHNVWDRFSNANLYVVLPWFWVITLISASFLDCFNFSGKRYYNLLYSIYISALISNITLLALPYVAIGAQLSKKIALLNFVLELAVLPFWLTLSRKFYFRCRPPLPSVLITDDPEGEAFMLEKVNRYSEKYRVDAITSPNDREIESIILSHKAVILGKLGTIDKAMFLRMCASMEKPVLIRPDYTDIMLSTSQSEQFDDLMMISVNKFGLTALGSGEDVYKRQGSFPAHGGVAGGNAAIEGNEQAENQVCHGGSGIPGAVADGDAPLPAGWERHVIHACKRHREHLKLFAAPDDLCREGQVGQSNDIRPLPPGDELAGIRRAAGMNDNFMAGAEFLLRNLPQERFFHAQRLDDDDFHLFSPFGCGAFSPASTPSEDSLTNSTRTVSIMSLISSMSE